MVRLVIWDAVALIIIIIVMGRSGWNHKTVFGKRIARTDILKLKIGLEMMCHIDMDIASHGQILDLEFTLRVYYLEWEQLFNMMKNYMAGQFTLSLPKMRSFQVSVVSTIFSKWTGFYTCFSNRSCDIFTRTLPVKTCLVTDGIRSGAHVYHFHVHWLLMYQDVCQNWGSLAAR